MDSELWAFTLVEVLAALVLLAIILPVAMRGISLATRTAGAARNRTVAASLAQTTLNELVLSSEWQEGDLSGDYGDEWPAYSWASEVQTWEESNLRRLDVRVEWASGEQVRSVTLSTLVQSREE
jgi:general secretion pathway protein I